MPTILLTIALSLAVSINAFAQTSANSVLFKFADGQSLLVEKNDNLLTFQRCYGAGQCQSLGRAEGYTAEEVSAAKKKMDLVGLAYGAGINVPLSACAGFLSAGVGLAVLAGGTFAASFVAGEIDPILSFVPLLFGYFAVIPTTIVAGLPGWAYGSEGVHNLTSSYDRLYRPSAILRAANPDGKTQFWQDEVFVESRLQKGENPNEFYVEGDADRILGRLEKVLNSIQ